MNRALGAWLALAVACRTSPPRPEQRSQAPIALDAAAVRDAAISAALPPLGGDWIQTWPMPRGKTAYVTPPLGARERRPIIVAVHGAQDRPDWACSEWQATVAHFAWVVCPQGTPLGAGFAWGSAEAIATQAFEALAAVREKYLAYVAEGPVLYGGFSQGASLAYAVVAAHPGAFDRVIMIEAGHTPLSASGVLAGFRRGGVCGIVVSCSTRACMTLAGEMEAQAPAFGIPLVKNDAGLRGHVFDGVVMTTLGATMITFLGDDPRYAGLADAIRSR